MFSTVIRKILSLDLEEKILNAALLFSMIGVLLPWIGGRLSLIDDQTVSYSGFGFYTSFIGFSIFTLLGFTLLITIVPLISRNQLIGTAHKNITRLLCTSLASILILSSLSVLMKVTFTSPGMEVRFGIYTALISSMIACLYAFLAFQDDKKKEVQQFFHKPTPVVPAKEEPHPRQFASTEQNTQRQVPQAPEPELHGQLRR